ncbi:tetratricopeptide repeat protein [Rubrobacter tropicus]|uniref:Tetratricopeptide repeat protein n=2 Tax=Rubrobacter tropicus TaxID=2653851 RepID=A0A6G8QAP1_9ACTN|nr:tetratricopeptide repeat protein [Rubrobacter tropicus]
MMMNRKRLGRVMAVVAIVLAAFFLLSSILLGFGMNTNYNLFDVFGNQDQAQQQDQVPSTQDAIDEAKKDLENNPKDPDAITDLAGLYAQNGQYDDAAKVLREGREKAPKNAEIPALLGSVYQQQAPGVEPKEQRELYGKAGDSFATATELDPKNEDLYAAAGQNYDQAGETAEAIKYYNGYLDREPNGQDSQAIKERISALLAGGEETTGVQP